MLFDLLIAAVALASGCVGAGLPFNLPPGQSNQDACIENQETGTVECIYTKLNSQFVVPAIYSNMTIDIFGASSGRALGRNNLPDDRTRGLGLRFSGLIADNLRDVTFTIHVAPNGRDAEIDKPGINPRQAFPLEGGNGGHCAGAHFKRYGAAGGPVTGVVRAVTPKWRQEMFIWAGGAGGPGAYDPQADQISKGANSPIITPGLGTSGSESGLTGLPKSLSGTGGTMLSAGLGGKTTTGQAGEDGSAEWANGGNGASIVTDAKFCLSGGGGGGGYRAGGGGATVERDRAFAKSAGSGGSGNSAIKQDGDRSFVYNIRQRNMFTETPRIVFSYSTAAAPTPNCSEALCVIMR